MGKLEVKGIATKTIDYDRMKINLKFYSKESSPAEASDKVMQECEDLLRVMEKDGLDISKMALEEDKVQESYSYRADREETYYTGERKIEIETGFDMRIINYVRAIINDKKMMVDFDVDFSLSNEEEIKKNLLTEALQDAKKQAEIMAQAIGQKVVGFVSADQKVTGGEYLKREPDILMQLSCDVDEDHYDSSNKLSATNTTVRESINTVWEIA